MKRILLALVFIFVALGARAQVGIGKESPDLSAQLDVWAEDKGILIPRVALTGPTDQTTISHGNVESLLVYHSGSGMSHGYYYWYNGRWNKILTQTDTLKNEITTLVYNNGQLIYTDEEDRQSIFNLENIVREHETLTTIVENSDGSLTYNDENGNQTLIPLPDLIRNYEEVTNITTNLEDGTITYINENGETTVININDLVEGHETLTYLKDNGDGTLRYTDEDTGTTDIDLKTIIKNYESVSSVDIDEGAGTITIIDGDNVTHTLNITELIDLKETVTTLVDNGNGTFTYTDENRKPFVLDINTLEVSVVDNVYTFTNAAGEVVVEIDTNADAITYNNTTSNLDATNIQDAIDEITNNIEQTNNQLGTINLVDNGDGQVTLIKPDGTTATVAKSDVTDNGNGTYTFSNKDDEDVTIDANTLQVTETNGVYTFTTDFLDANGERTVLAEIDTKESAGDVTYEGDLDVTNVQEALDEIQTIINNTETKLTKIDLVDNNDGTFTYTDEDGGTVEFDARTLNVSSTVSGIYDFTDVNGDPVVTIDTNAVEIGFDNTTSDLVSNNVQAAIEEILSTRMTTSVVGGTDNVKVTPSEPDENNNTEYIVDVTETETSLALSDETTEVIVNDGSPKQVNKGRLVYKDENENTTTINAVMPKFFYMPSIVIPTDASIDGFGEIDLYEKYLDQFGTPQLSSDSSVSIPVLERNELAYTITYFDTSVFENVRFSNIKDGVLLYEVSSEPITARTYMNIVFVVKD